MRSNWIGRVGAMLIGVGVLGCGGEEDGWPVPPATTPVTTSAQPTGNQVPVEQQTPYDQTPVQTPNTVPITVPNNNPPINANGGGTYSIRVEEVDGTVTGGAYCVLFDWRMLAAPLGWFPGLIRWMGSIGGAVANAFAFGPVKWGLTTLALSELGGTLGCDHRLWASVGGRVGPKSEVWTGSSLELMGSLPKSELVGKTLQIHVVDQDALAPDWTGLAINWDNTMGVCSDQITEEALANGLTLECQFEPWGWIQGLEAGTGLGLLSRTTSFVTISFPPGS